MANCYLAMSFGRKEYAVVTNDIIFLSVVNVLFYRQGRQLYYEDLFIANKEMSIVT